MKAIIKVPKLESLTRTVIGRNIPENRYATYQIVPKIKKKMLKMEQHTAKNVNNSLNTKIYSNLETSGGQSSNTYLNVAHFLVNFELIRNLWQLKTAVFLQWCPICAVPLHHFNVCLRLPFSSPLILRIIRLQ